MKRLVVRSKAVVISTGLVLISMSLAPVLGVSPVVAESLYDEKTYQSIIADKKASQLGDTITVLIVETSQAESNTGSNVNEGISMGGSIGKRGLAELGSIDMDVGRNSGGSTQRAGQFKASLTAQVKEINELGSMYVEGSQEIILNGERQVISINGWLRPEDIAVNNTVISTRLSDAHIEYTGFGVQSDTHKPGFIHWIFSKVGLI